LGAVAEVAGKSGEQPHKTRRKYVRVGSVAASMLLTVLSGSHSPLAGYRVLMFTLSYFVPVRKPVLLIG